MSAGRRRGKHNVPERDKERARGGKGADCREGIVRQRNKRRKRKPWNPGSAPGSARRKELKRVGRIPGRESIGRRRGEADERPRGVWTTALAVERRA